MTDPALCALSNLPPDEFAKHAAYRDSRHQWAEATGRPVQERAQGGFPAGERKGD